MSFARFKVLASLVLFSATATSAVLAQDASGIGPAFGDNQPAPPVSLLYAGPAPVGSTLLSCPSCPRLYDNTEICTVDALSLAVGGSGTPGLALRDWFTSAGGNVTRFDLLVTNCGTGAIPNHLSMNLFEGTDAETLGTLLGLRVCNGGPNDLETCFDDGDCGGASCVSVTSGFTTQGAPVLSRIPVHCDAVTGEPRIMRVTVDFAERAYTVVDALDGTPLISPEVQNIGRRVPISNLPAGKLGIEIRFIGENSLCAGGSPKMGMVMAQGGSGNENGLHIPNANHPNCTAEEHELVCDNVEWAPVDEFGNPIPCIGGNVCSTNFPYFGLAVAIYIGPSEDVNGNNTTQTADTIVLDPPSPCQGDTFTQVGGFIGDNSLSDDGEAVKWFDCAEDHLPGVALDLYDFQCLQQCFAQAPISNECEIFDHDPDGIFDGDPGVTIQQRRDGKINANDLFGFFICSHVDDGDPSCNGLIPDPPSLLRDVDMYQITGVSTGHVLSVLLEGDKSANTGPTWDPFLRVFKRVGANPLEEIARSDDYERETLDGFTTVEVPAGVSGIFVGVSANENSAYVPATDGPGTRPEIAADQAGGYILTVGATNPNCVVDNLSGNETQCYQSKHEPDDKMSNVLKALCENAQGEIDITGACLFPIGMLGDGAFSGTGQDLDLYKFRLDGDLSSVRSLTATIVTPVSQGFASVYDIVLGLYNEQGELIATGDQAQGSVFPPQSDQSRPLLAANVDPGGIFYLGVFGTDRRIQEVVETGPGVFNCQYVFPTFPPSLLNFPHGPGVAGTNEANLIPSVGGRVNKPRLVFDEALEGMAPDPLEGCKIPSDPNPAETLQCYKVNILTFPFDFPAANPIDLCDLISGNDSIEDACAMVPANRLSAIVPEPYFLGNGVYGGFQGDVDFFEIPVQAGQVISAHTSDTIPPQPDNNGRVRMYLGLFDQNAELIAEHDYSHEHEVGIGVDFDRIADEFSATIAGIMPANVGTNAYLMLGIDNGNMDHFENSPFDASVPGTTLSRRFETQSIPIVRRYLAGAAVMPRQTTLAGASPTGLPRMFVVPIRGSDDIHTSCFLNRSDDGRAGCHPAILEIDPLTGQTNVVRSTVFFSPVRDASGLDNGVAGRVDSSELLIAYDGSNLYVSPEFCPGGIDPLCDFPRRRLFRLNPNVLPTSGSYVTNMGELLGLTTGDFYSGMTEINGRLYALNESSNNVRWWNKATNPVATNGGTIAPVPSAVLCDPEPVNDMCWDSLYGDIGTDGTHVLIPCTFTGEEEEVLEYGICRFLPDHAVNPPTLTLISKLADPVTNPRFVEGPILGGLDSFSGTLIATDQRGPIVEYVTGASGDNTAGTVRAIELPHQEFRIRRLTAR